MTNIGTATRVSAGFAVIAASVLLTGCVTTVSGTATRAQNPGADVAPLDESKLEDVVLTIGEVNTIMGARTMEVTSELEDMTDHSDQVSEPECLGAVYGAEEPVYAGSGWKAVLDQIAREEGDDNDHWVEQTLVLYPSADKALNFFDKSKAIWESCANYTVSVDDGGNTYDWELGEVTAKDNLITQLTIQSDADGWGCQHALSPVSNITVEVWACSYDIGDEAATIVNDVVANVTKK
ncbi:sensor domain-containing protein [Mycolicibacterium moriokaense]|uniref:Sensor domain-containing protein n=1 Tax=Mycolicibacterium moriokaense TaxID=39691 RepID=A0AAD1HAC9_9MYCO|nr:sensor domain-containing protein [Mycolicibacterium moriokaense]MCV7039784.1 sensor domain-containing protein [Mycolicibacterium moriokaense]BBX01768.1 sensor domain-containing protein [Mycolicibacterium moriokaense]